MCAQRVFGKCKCVGLVFQKLATQLAAVFNSVRMMAQAVLAKYKCVQAVLAKYKCIQAILAKYKCVLHVFEKCDFRQAENIRLIK